MNRCPTLLAVLIPCLGAACSNFGTFALPEHAHLDRLALDPAAELPTVHLTAGTPVTAVRYTGKGVPVGLWIVTAEPGLVACEWHADGTDNRRAAITVVGTRPGASTAFYLAGGDAAQDAVPDPDRRTRLQQQKDWLQQHRHHREQASGSAAGKAGYEGTWARWNHLLDLDLATCSEAELRLAWLRGEADARFQLVVDAGSTAYRAPGSTVTSR